MHLDIFPPKTKLPIEKKYDFARHLFFDTIAWVGFIALIGNQQEGMCKWTRCFLPGDTLNISNDYAYFEKPYTLRLAKEKTPGNVSPRFFLKNQAEQH